MKIGIIGRTGSGRWTLFDALAGTTTTIRAPGKTRLGVAKVFDSRVDILTGICKPKKTVFAEVNLALPPNATNGPVDLREIREMRDIGAYAQVVGVFGDEEIEDSAIAQMAELSTELVLADMERAENRQARLTKSGGARPGEEDLLRRALAQLESEKPLRLLEWDENARGLLDELGLLSHKSLMTVINVAESKLVMPIPASIKEKALSLGSELFWMCASLEGEIAALDTAAQQEFLAAYSLSQPVSHRFVQATLNMLHQICFFTVGPDEVRAWNIERGSHARRAARAIHTDLEKGFIRAEVIDYDVFVELGSEAKCRTAGKLRLEGKDYIVKDGDILTIRFNV